MKLILALLLLLCLPLAAHAESQPISANPAAVNVTAGNGALQTYLNKKLGIQNTYGIKFDGAWLGDVNDLFSGGIPHADKWTTNSLFLFNLTVNPDAFSRWQGALFGIQFLQFNGGTTNAAAGSVQGYNSLPGVPPLNRSELYQLWLRQELLNKKLVIRIGKVVPTFDFNNVVKPVPLQQDKAVIPAVTGLIYTPIFVNPSMLGVLPGYYDSAYGITVNFVPNRVWYLSLGTYDGNMAGGTQTGLTGPNFNGSYFHIGETGLAWLIGKNNLPGSVGVGAWHQTGLIVGSPTLSEHGASGYYLFGSQRLWYQHPDSDNSGISMFYQFGANNSSALPMTEYIGAGLTAFGLVPSRLQDSMGIGAACAWLNRSIFTRKTELMFQAYYQAQLTQAIYLEPVLSYLPTPGAKSHLNPAWAGTLRLIVLF